MASPAQNAKCEGRDIARRNAMGNCWARTYYPMEGALVFSGGYVKGTGWIAAVAAAPPFFPGLSGAQAEQDMSEEA